MNELMTAFVAWLNEQWQAAVAAVSSPFFYSQVGAVVVVLIAASMLAGLIRHRVRLFSAAPVDGPLLQLRTAAYAARSILRPALALVLLGITIEIFSGKAWDFWLIRIVQGLAGVAVVFGLLSRLVQNRFARYLLAWIGIPIAILRVFGWLAPLTNFLDAHGLSLGNFEPTWLDIARTLVFGALLFWLGAISNTAGKNVIRTRENWNPNTRELAAKLFEISLFFLIFLLLMELLGVNLTALAVFGGALGIGLGFGLQQIASNFISGIIILVDRSITPGDYIELEDGRSGWLRELNMRHGILETYDGKDIMVPNEVFVTTSYTNWTHKDKRQRYSLHFQVAYATDLDLLFEKVREICRAHPKVISDPSLPIEYHPDAEIEGFGESGIDILCEFWMNGIDDGENRVGADLMHSIWNMIQEHGMQIPFPQREIRILGGTVGIEQPGKA
jgi:small-conductance mechanosensitive channel